MAESNLLTIGTKIVWTFPGTDHRYYGVITEVHSVKRKGDEERYRIKGEHMDCYAFRRELAVEGT